MDQEIHIAVEGEQWVFSQWMKRSEKNARPQKFLGHGIVLNRRFVGVAQEANRLKAARAIIVEFLGIGTQEPPYGSLGNRVAPAAIARMGTAVTGKLSNPPRARDLPARQSEMDFHFAARMSLTFAAVSGRSLRQSFPSRKLSEIDT
jgi:hypothetical protein